MNALRTIPRSEQKQWISLMFEIGPHKPANAPDYPLTFLLPFGMRHNITGNFLYVVYQSEIIGYGKVGRVEWHEGSAVGGTDEPIGAGDNIILDGPLVRMPFPVKYQGFQGIRCTEKICTRPSRKAIYWH